jgi:hypothetical protein
LAKYGRFDLLGIDSATNGTTRAVRDLNVNQAIELIDFAKDYRTLSRQPILRPE